MEKALVIGGAGFLGARLATALQRAGVTTRVFDLQPHPDPAIDSITGDLLRPEQVAAACAGVDTVFQTAALVDWGPRSRDRIYAVNVEGNRHVIAACQAQGVQRLVYTSSVDVVFDGRPLAGADESTPYAARSLDDYGRSKILGEQDALAANGQGGLLTTVLRTTGIYGPGDRHRLPSIFKAAKAGKMMKLGDGRARFRHVYVDNAAHAHVLAGRALAPGSRLAGAVYFIGDHPPQNFYDFFDPFLLALGYTPPARRLPTRLAYALALALESLGRVGIGPQPPLLTRYVVLSTCVDFYFRDERAARDFGYAPVVTEAEAQTATIDWLRAEGWAAG